MFFNQRVIYLSENFLFLYLEMNIVLRSGWRVHLQYVITVSVNTIILQTIQIKSSLLVIPFQDSYS